MRRVAENTGRGRPPKDRLDAEAIRIVLEKHRRERGWSWSDFARKTEGLGISFLTAVRIGNRGLTPKIVRALATALGCDPEALVLEFALEAVRLAEGKLLARYPSGSFAAEERVEALHSIIDGLQGDDVYAAIVSGLPAEFSDPDLRAGLRRAAERGARLYYVFPRSGDSNDPLPPGIAGYAARNATSGLVSAFEDFRRALSAHEHAAPRAPSIEKAVAVLTPGPYDKHSLLFIPAFARIVLTGRKVYGDNEAPIEGAGRLQLAGWIDVPIQGNGAAGEVLLRLPSPAAADLWEWFQALRDQPRL